MSSIPGKKNFTVSNIVYQYANLDYNAKYYVIYDLTEEDGEVYSVKRIESTITVDATFCIISKDPNTKENLIFSENKDRGLANKKTYKYNKLVSRTLTKESPTKHIVKANTELTNKVSLLAKQLETNNQS